MSIKITNTKEREHIIFDTVFLEKFIYAQAGAPGSKRTVQARMYISGTTDSGIWEYDKDSKVELNVPDIDMLAMQIHMTRTGATLEESMQAYGAAMIAAESANFLETMAYFEKGVAMLFEHQTANATGII